MELLKKSPNKKWKDLKSQIHLNSNLIQFMKLEKTFDLIEHTDLNNLTRGGLQRVVAELRFVKDAAERLTVFSKSNAAFGDFHKKVKDTWQQAKSILQTRPLSPTRNSSSEDEQEKIGILPACPLSHSLKARLASLYPKCDEEKLYPEEIRHAIKSLFKEEEENVPKLREFAASSKTTRDQIQATTSSLRYAKTTHTESQLLFLSSKDAFEQQLKLATTKSNELNLRIEKFQTRINRADTFQAQISQTAEYLFPITESWAAQHRGLNDLLRKLIE